MSQISYALERALSEYDDRVRYGATLPDPGLMAALEQVRRVILKEAQINSAQVERLDSIATWQGIADRYSGPVSVLAAAVVSGKHKVYASGKQVAR